jgi:hypothetical protein
MGALHYKPYGREKELLIRTECIHREHMERRRHALARSLCRGVSEATTAVRSLQVDHQRARRVASAASAHTVKGTAAKLPCLGGALDGMKPGSCGYMRPGGEPPIEM